MEGRKKEDIATASFLKTWERPVLEDLTANQTEGGGVATNEDAVGTGGHLS